MIYLDNAATTFPKPNEVLDYVDWVQRNIAVNVGRGSYSVAKEAMSIVEEGKAKKVIVYKYKNKSGYHKKNGHRQLYTKVKIDKINAY